ncbi:putative secreted protein [Proteiniphilum saccharofermentans]|uniref:Putative secreted protein n=1 Tax=Proteiniphilum saccharofermentans TaxID=1642647 RepID=A0A1R3SZ33_9BACT|nr:hypothetical protein [Proteiniphilum saccharofermentans]SCD21446.1 putative secreted protein [Proteiniphilum saccharofermentans]
MKRTIFIIILLAALTIQSAEAQETNYINISVDAGLVANTSRDKKFGLGGTIGWLTQDNLLSLNSNNYISLSVKAFNNPYGEGKILSSIKNDADDAFNYIMPLAGYRFTQEGISDGFFVEPRIGAVFGASYAGLAFSPIAGYAVQQFNFSIYCDMGFAGKESAIRKKSFFTPGISVAYNISLN